MIARTFLLSMCRKYQKPLLKHQKIWGKEGAPMKVRHSIILEEDNYVAASAMYKLRNFRNVSELVNRALEEYLARQAGQRVESILSQEMVSVIENTILLSERRINRILFKLAVGDAEMKHVIAIASQFQDRIELLAKIHEQSEREVRITNGLLNFKTALEQLNGNKMGADEWEEN